jgi:biopolymer transport protein ExbD
MSSYVHQRKRQVAVPIITLIDILAILLIFVVVTHELPEEKAFANITPPSSSVLGKAMSTGGRIELAIKADGSVLLGAEAVADGRLAARLRRLKADRPEAKLELKADEDAPLKALVGVWDALTRAGFRVKDVPSRILLEKPNQSSSPDSPQ